MLYSSYLPVGDATDIFVGQNTHSVGRARRLGMGVLPHPKGCLVPVLGRKGQIIKNKKIVINN